MSTSVARRIPFRCSKGIEFVPLESILYIQSDANNSVIHMNTNKKLLLTCSLGKLETQMANYKMFYRIHHQYLVSLLHIISYIKGDGGEVVLIDGQTLPVSRIKKKGFLNWVKRLNME
ncbi:MAG: LytTR family DNA-binding domain-containing protein [Saprospiraceae bacterium]